MNGNDDFDINKPLSYQFEVIKINGSSPSI
jgi:hypothetical protein